MPIYKTITCQHNGVEYRFEVELWEKTIYDVSRKNEFCDSWERVDMEAIPDVPKILMYRKLIRLRKQLRLY